MENQYIDIKNAKLTEIGKGGYSTVYKVDFPPETQQKTMALKVRKFHSENSALQGIPTDVLREVSLMRQIKHRNICKMIPYEIQPKEHKIRILLDFYQFDLRKFYNQQEINESVIKNVAYETLKGLFHLHSHRIIHRDIKPQNILLNNESEIVLSDFGFARKIDLFNNEYTNLVGTHSYRSPELLLGSKSYSVSIDIWALGCALVEMINKSPIFYGTSDMAVLVKQLEILSKNKYKVLDLDYGSVDWSAIKKKDKKKKLKCLLEPVLSPEGIDLIEKMLEPSPSKRIEAKYALNHEWFNNKNNLIKKE